MSSAQLTELKQQQELLETQIKVKALEKRAKLLESWASWDVYGTSSSGWWHQDATRMMQFRSSPSDRKGGHDWPFLRHESDLDRYRQLSRELVRTNGGAKGLLKNITNYVVGTGSQISIVAKQNLADASAEDPGFQLPQGVKRLQQQVQSFVNLWAKKIKLRWREREMYRRTKRDGEFFLRLFESGNGLLLLRWIEPEQVRNPTGATEQDGWTFGIKHYAEYGVEDIEQVEAFHVVHPYYFNPERGGFGGELTAEGEIIDAHDVIHVKNLDEDCTVARGLPEFIHDTYDAFRRANSLQANSSEGSAMRAAIAVVSQWEHATQSEIDDFVQAEADYSRSSDRSGNLERIKEVQGPYHYHTAKGHQFVPTPSASGVSTDVQVQQADLRLGVAAFCAPEFFTGDASNANYASTREASAPIAKAAKTEQDYFAEVIEDLAIRAINLAIDHGKLPPRTLDFVEVQVEYPAVVEKEPQAEAQRLLGLVQGRIQSPQTSQLELGLDPEVEQANWAEWDEQYGGQDPFGGMMSGMGGEDGGFGGGAFGESIMEGFTGVITDKRNRRIHYIDGKRVKKDKFEETTGKKSQEVEPTKKEPKQSVKPKTKSKQTKQSAKEVKAAKQAQDQLAQALADPASVNREELKKSLNSLTVVQLKESLKAAQAKLSGKKAELIQRLVGQLDSKIARAESTGFPQFTPGKSTVAKHRSLPKEKFEEIKTLLEPLGGIKKLADWVGAPDGSKITVESLKAPSGGGPQIELKFTFQGGSAHRVVKFDKEGNPLQIFNKKIEIANTGKGLGSEIFGRQVYFASQAGFKTLKCLAARTVTMNGYYTWPRLGYDGMLPMSMLTLDGNFPENFPDAQSVSDLMKTQEGRDYWRKHGSGFFAEFDLSSDSQSMQILTNYLNAKRNK